mgnify:CR=1 FL=1
MAPCNFSRARMQQRLDVRRSRQARPMAITGMLDRFGERNGGIEIEALQQAIAGNVGVDQGGDAHILEPPGDVERRRARTSRPALHRHLAVAGIERRPRCSAGNSVRRLA